MAAFRVRGPLEETDRHNVRNAINEGSEVFLMEKEPLAIEQLSLSPPSKQTYLVVEHPKPEREDLRATLKELKQKYQAVIDKDERRNEKLYRPIFSSRELAIVSLLMYQRNLLDELVEKEVRVRAREIEKNGQFGNRKERKMAKRAFLEQFGANQKLSYFQLARACENSNNQDFHQILARSEEAFLKDYQSLGCTCEEAINVRSSMRALRLVKKCRDQSCTHMFDYNYSEKGRSTIEEQRTSRKLQASVLIDLQNATNNDWLEGNFKTLGDPHSGTLVLEVTRKIKELENLWDCDIAELAEMP